MASGWMKFKKEKVLKAIKNSGGNKLLISRRLGCSRDTVTHYLERDKDILKAFEDEIEDIGDLCECQLVNKIKEGNLTAMIFYAKTKLKHRGYVERQEVDSTQPVVIHIDKDDENA